jgi:hypothetical protein
LVLCAAVSAQALRSQNDPRNQSPAVGTGGPEGGPTGLFTIYDGSTLRRGEFTFSIAYSNYDRDPGNADFVDIPLSFNVGINDHLELFFKTLGYRGVKVNNPLNLSGFYLPNSQVFCGTVLCSPPAIILAPSGPNVGTLNGVALFRPLNNQPFVQYPFTGGSAGSFGLTAGGGPAGFPGFNAQLGPPIIGPNSGTFGSADNFPGVGAPVGGILPGVVLATDVIPGTLLTRALTVPTVFTTAPAYLPDAPFINRLYGESSFSNFVVGAKVRFTGPRNPLGVALVGFYRFYPDKADDFSGFNQMQRGAGPGGDIGDFGFVGIVDGRIHKHVNLSANGGLIFNSNPKGPGGEVLLDRPNELLSGVGFDFPINRHFQPIAEVRSTHYIGGKTPNAFPNNPIEVIGGIKIYPRRWFGFGIAYRRHLNQQDREHFEEATASTQIVQVTNVDPLGPPATVVTVPATSRVATVDGFPRGFNPSEEPNGFIAQFWIGRRNIRSTPAPPNQPPTVSAVSTSISAILRPCPPGQNPVDCTPTGNEVQLTANATDPDNDTLLYTWSVTGGRLTGEGRTVTWDLSGVATGSYTATVEVDDGNQHKASGSATVTVGDCRCAAPPPPCPTVSVSCASTADPGTPIKFTASVSGGEGLTLTYNWSVSAGTITSGQSTNEITVDTTGLGGQTVTATVSLGGVDPSCTGTTASCSTSITAPPPPPTKFDEYGDIRFNDEKARLDNFAIQLQNQPGSTATIIAYGSCAGQAQTRADRAKDYLVNTRGIDAGRITTIDGGCRSDLTVQLWIVPAGATAPTADPAGVISPCPECRRRPAPRRRRGDE